MRTIPKPFAIFDDLWKSKEATYTRRVSPVRTTIPHSARFDRQLSVSALSFSLFLHRCSIENGVGLAVTRSRTGSVSRPVEREEGKTKRPVERPVPRGGRRGSKNKRDTRRTSVPERGPAGRGQGRVLVQAVVALVRVEPLVQNGNRSLPGRVAGTCLLERTGTRADPLGPAAVVRGRRESQSLPASIEQILARGDDHRR